MYQFRSGFTLIELSIILVIIGLLAGGVLVGKELIEAARIRKIVQAHEDFATRWNTFRLKYNCLPGDCTNATMFFSLSGSCPSVSATATCNGNGDKWIYWAIDPNEPGLVWNHLFHAGLMKETPHSGTATTAIYNQNYVQAPNGTGLVIWMVGTTSTPNYAQVYASASNGNAGSDLKGIGLQTLRKNSPGTQPIVGAEPPSVVRNIDVKMDDGIPATGKFRASAGYAMGGSAWETCITGTGDSSAYDLTQTEPNCRYIYSIQ